MVDMPISHYSLKLTKGAKLLLAYLWRYAGRDLFVWPSREIVIEHLCIESDRTLRRYLHELRKIDVIVEDVQFRQGGLREGWWLRTDQAYKDEAASSAAAETGDVVRNAPEDEQRPDCATSTVGDHVDRNGRARTEMAAAADRNGRARTEMTAAAAKNGHATSIELPINNSLSLTLPNWRSPGVDGQEIESESMQLAKLRRWRRHGGDPGGLGPWPRPRTPEGVELPALTLSAKIRGLLAEERTPAEIHEAVHLVAELVEAGELGADRWRSGYVFSGWLDGLVVKALERRAKRQRAKSAPREGRGPTTEGQDAGATCESILAALEASTSLQSVATTLRKGPAARRKPRGRTPTLEVVDVRIELDAIADAVGREPAEILRALGCDSVRDLGVEHKPRLRRVLLELGRGATIEEIAACWALSEPTRSAPESTIGL